MCTFSTKLSEFNYIAPKGTPIDIRTKVPKSGSYLVEYKAPQNTAITKGTRLRRYVSVYKQNGTNALSSVDNWIELSLGISVQANLTLTQTVLLLILISKYAFNSPTTAKQETHI